MEILKRSWVSFIASSKKTYKVEEVDLNLHFSMELHEGEMVGEKEALEAFRYWQKPSAAPLSSLPSSHSQTGGYFSFTGKPQRGSPTG